MLNFVAQFSLAIYSKMVPTHCKIKTTHGVLLEMLSHAWPVATMHDTSRGGIKYNTCRCYLGRLFRLHQVMSVNVQSKAVA
jgi:hypothetical protein